MAIGTLYPIALWGLTSLTQESDRRNHSMSFFVPDTNVQTKATFSHQRVNLQGSPVG
jgi:hypothetical protein